MHCKFYGISGPGRTVVFAGSANCSQAALTIPGKGGNAELLAIETLGENDFRDRYLAEIQILDEMPDLPETRKEEAKGEDTEEVRIFAARYDGGLLKIAYQCKSDINITRGFVDGVAFPFLSEGGSLGSIELSITPRTVVLEGVLGGTSVRSKPFWVDVEAELRSTARGRSFAGILRESVQAGRWGIGAWKDILDVFCKHLQYLPSRSSGWGRAGIDHQAKKLAEYTAQDVFSTAYGLPSLGSAVRAGLADDRVQSLQQMLLRWFGIHSPEESEAIGPPAPEEDGDEEVVDRPERLTPKIFSKPRPASDADRKRAKKSIEQITKAMTSKEFLANRPPELLAADIKIIAVLLRTGLREGWIEKSDFFEATHPLWSSLFFTSDGSPNQGWIERRQRESGDPDDFALRMASPELCAALAAWCMTTGSSKATPQSVSLALSQVLAAARLPWIWRGADLGRISQELGGILANTKEDLSPKKAGQLEEEWLLLVRRGEAFNLLEEALKGHTPAELRERISQNHISAGELLWQGISGYCVVLEECRRSQLENVRVIPLQGSKKEVEFKPRYLIPIKSLLEEGILRETDQYGAKQRELIQGLIEELAEPFSTEGET